MSLKKKNADDQAAIPCPYCGGTSCLYVSTPDVNRKASNDIFNLNRCNACGLMFVVNPPADLGLYYTDDYHFSPESAEELEPHLPGQQFKIDLVKNHISNGKLMEIGPSNGAFCYLAQKAGFDVSAIEMDPSCAKFLNEKLGVKTFNSADPAGIFRADEQQYDAICMWHSLEHITEPWVLLERAIERLNPGGIFVIACPNPQSSQVRLMGKHWVHFDLPRHLYQLPITWVLELGRKFGLRPELVTTRDEGSLYWSWFSWGMLLQSFAVQKRPRKKLFKAGIRLGKLLNFYEGREGVGAAYTIVLKRPA